jgi:aryl carrier-like protein
MGRNAMQQPTDPSTDQPGPEDTELYRTLTAAQPAERAEILVETVREVASAILDRPAFDIDSNFLENGLTSLRALELGHKLTALTGIEIPLVAIIEYPTPADLGRFMAESIAEAAV